MKPESARERSGAAQAMDAGPPWRVLLVDDCADDTELVCIELAHGGLDVLCRRVDSEPQVLEALRSFKPHLVLSDINMPGFSGERALQLVHDAAPATPFAYLSGDRGAYGEETPAGDVEHLSKDRLDQLPAFARRLLGTAEFPRP